MMSIHLMIESEPCLCLSLALVNGSDSIQLPFYSGPRIRSGARRIQLAAGRNLSAVAHLLIDYSNRIRLECKSTISLTSSCQWEGLSRWPEVGWPDVSPRRQLTVARTEESAPLSFFWPTQLLRSNLKASKGQLRPRRKVAGSSAKCQPNSA